MENYRPLRRSVNNRMVGGICGGLGIFFGIDPTVIRLAVVFIALMGWTMPVVVAYLIMLMVVPEEPSLNQTLSSVPPVSTVSPVEPEGPSQPPFPSES